MKTTRSPSITGEAVGPHWKCRFGLGSSRCFQRVAPVAGSRHTAHCFSSVSAAVNASPLASTTALLPHPMSACHSIFGPSGGHWRNSPVAL